MEFINSEKYNTKYVDKKAFSHATKIYNSLNNKPQVYLKSNGFIDMTWKDVFCTITYDEALIHNKKDFKKYDCLLPFDTNEYPFECIQILKKILKEITEYDHIV